MYRTTMDGKLELCDDIMGTCTALNPMLLDKVGYYVQCSPFYGADDVLLSVRSKSSRVPATPFCTHIDIDHIDEGGTAYTEWKKREAGVYLQEVSILCDLYRSGELDVYYNPFE